MVRICLLGNKFMSNFTKGGRGKQAPYETTHCRIPTPIKEIVHSFASAYKTTVGSSEISTSHLLSQVQASITKAMSPQENLVTSISGNSSNPNGTSDFKEELDAIRQVLSEWKENSKNTRDWTKANQLLKELEEALSSAEK